MTHHCLVLRSSVTLDETELSRRLADGARQVALWTESLPYPSDDPRAARLRARTAARGMAPGRADTVRITLLSYADGAQDLSLTADDCLVDEAGLHQLACLLAGGSDLTGQVPRPAPAASGDDCAHRSSAGPAPAMGGVRDAGSGDAGAGDSEGISLEWAAGATAGRGVRGVASVPIVGAGDPRAAVLAALGGAMSRRIGADSVPMTLCQAGSAGPWPAQADIVRSVSLPVPATAEPSEVLAAAEEALGRLAEPGSADTPAAAGGNRDLELRLPVPEATLHLFDEAGLRPLLRVAATSAVLAFRLDTGPEGAVLACDHRADLVAREAVELLLVETAREVRALMAGPAADRDAGLAAAGEPAPPSGDGVAEPAAGRETEHAAAGGEPSAAADTIHGLVSAMTTARPDTIAVTAPEGSLSYRELDAWAEEVAARLYARGVGPGQLVGVSLPRGQGLVAALLGVLKSGAAYVPLDPSYPRDRLRYMAEDAGVSLVVTQEAGEAFSDRPCMALEPVTGDPRAVGSAPRPARPDDPAYVIHTSGSTGRPKGVMVEHGNFTALLSATREEFELSEHDVWTFFHSYAFDFSVWEIWGCLATGGRLVVVPGDVARAPEDFQKLLDAESVTVLNQTPSAFVQLLTALPPPAAEPLAVRLLIFGGEPLDSRTLLPWFDRHPEDRCRVVNMYGITETTVHCTWETLGRRDALTGSRSVGPPLPGWTVHVLDPYGRPLPTGTPGEIYVGGAGVARGYHGLPGLTAQRFRPDHLSARPGARLYRSGDRGRLRHDGRLEHLGRLDGQVKVRGYRIELDEIRNRLLQHDGVRAAAVALHHRGEARDAHLDAYVVGAGADPGALREHLERSLPAFMVPSTITVLDRLPTTGNGKLDVARLPDPAVAGPKPSAPADVTPDLASRIARVWQDVLGAQVSLDDNFFLIGGNSLLAIRIMARLREQKITNEPVRALYRHPTLRRLAQALAETTA